MIDLLQRRGREGHERGLPLSGVSNQVDRSTSLIGLRWGDLGGDPLGMWKEKLSRDLFAISQFSGI